MKVHLDCKVQIATLIIDKIPIIIPTKYSNFDNVFFKKSTIVLPEHIEINTNAINLEKSKQPLYQPIHSLGILKLETLKTYIETNLANNFICSFKSPVSAPILFNKKLNGSF